MTADRAALAVTADMPLTKDVNEVTRADFLAVSRAEPMYPGGACAPASPFAPRPGDAPAQRSATCTLSARPESVCTGRDFTRATIRDWGLAALADAAQRSSGAASPPRPCPVRHVHGDRSGQRDPGDAGAGPRCGKRPWAGGGGSLLRPLGMAPA